MSGRGYRQTKKIVSILKTTQESATNRDFDFIKIQVFLTHFFHDVNREICTLPKCQQADGSHRLQKAASNDGYKD